MIGLHISKAPPYILDKINNICSLLREGRNQYERVALTIKDDDLRSTILTLAQESNQYACELSSQVETLGGTPDSAGNIKEEPRGELQNLVDDNYVFSFCKINEKKVVSAYQEILNESYLYEGLRKMIRYQLNEMLCTFMQLKQLRYLKLH